MKNLLLVLMAACTLLTACNTKSARPKAASGYEYTVLKEGDGKKPATGDFVYFQMDIHDDKWELLQSYRNQQMVPSIQILAADDPVRKTNPIVDILSYCQVGDSIVIVVPRDSMPAMPPGYEDLKFIQYVVVVQDVLTPADNEVRITEERNKQMAAMEAAQARMGEVELLTEKTLKQYKSNQLDLQTTENGVKYILHEKGTGDLPSKDRMISVHYYGRVVKDGSMFDNSLSKGQPFSFRVGRGEVIQGWDQIALNLPVGSKASVFIPSELGYGDTDQIPEIPANSELYFYMEIIEMFY